MPRRRNRRQGPYSQPNSNYSGSNRHFRRQAVEFDGWGGDDGWAIPRTEPREGRGNGEPRRGDWGPGSRQGRPSPSNHGWHITTSTRNNRSNADSPHAPPNPPTLEQADSRRGESQHQAPRTHSVVLRSNKSSRILEQSQARIDEAGRVIGQLFLQAIYESGIRKVEDAVINAAEEWRLQHGPPTQMDWQSETSTVIQYVDKGSPSAPSAVSDESAEQLPT
jgi:hypothetical protein